MAAAFAERLREAREIAVTPAHARALQLDMPRSRRSLYYLTREIFVTDAGQVATFDLMFAQVFGKPAGADRYREGATALTTVVS